MRVSAYSVLLLDHDDTVVQSTPEIHYPSWVEILSVLRPGYICTPEEFARYNFDPGFFGYARDIMHFNEEEMEYDLKVWSDWVRRIIPHPYPGMAEIIRRHKAEGGLVCVSTHSCREFIERDYRAHIGILPDAVYGLECGEDKIKPDPFAVEEIVRTYGVKKEEILMVDDMRPGYDMARRAGIPFCYAGWSAVLPEIQEFMRANADFCCDTVEEFEKLLWK